MNPYVTEEQIRASKAVNTLAFLFLWALTNREIRPMRGCGEHKDFFAEM